jgi:exodeoxyribonuclease VII small subunit
MTVPRDVSAPDLETSPPTQAAEPAQNTSFEVALAELGRIVTGLESGSLGLSESIQAYERGVALIRRLHDELARVEARVSVLVRIDDEGRPVLAPHEGGDLAPAERRPAKRSARGKAGGSRPLPGMDEATDEP